MTFIKNIALFRTKFLLSSLLALSYIISFAQTTLFSENMGTTGAAGNPAITTFTVFQNYGCLYTFGGAGDVRNSTSSSGYAGASGSNNVFLARSSSKTLIISRINTLGFSALSLSYGLYNSALLSTGAGFVVETSTNGVTYTALTRPGNLWLLPSWLSETCTGTIPNTSNLYLRFTNTSGSIDFRIDDIKLTGTPSITDPTPYNSWPTAFTFNNWASSTIAGSFPANMVFHYGNANILDPNLAQVTATEDYELPYNLACGTRITGQASNGISFANSNPGNTNATKGNLGEAVIALNTSCRSNVQVLWKAGTIANNGIIYKLRAQYRIGTAGAYTDLPNATLSQIEYTSPGVATNFGPITLPTTCENQAVVELRWVYYYGGSGAGARDEINLTNISVSSDPIFVYSVTGGGSFCSGGTGVAIGLSNSQSGLNYQLYNGVTTVGAPVAGTGSAISFGNNTSAGTYTVKAMFGVGSCPTAMNGSAVVIVNPTPTITPFSNQTVCGGKIINAINFSSTPPSAIFTWSNTNVAIGLGASGSGNIAAYTSPVIPSPPNQVGVVTVSASLGSCTAITTNFSLTVKGPQIASVWNGIVSNDWFDSDNWSNCVCGAITSATVPSIVGPNFNPLISGTVAANVNTITLNASSNLSIQNTQTLNLFGGWINNGTFNAQQGNVIITGPSAQIIGGTVPTTFYDLTLNNAAGSKLTSAQNIQGSLQLNSGSLNTNNFLTLVSNASGTGKIGPINPAADIINQVTVQQYAPGGATGWALLGSPISSALNMTSWNDNFAITCSSCPDGSLVASVPFTSIYSYNETIAGTYSAIPKYIPITTVTNTITNGSGYWVYLGNSFPSTSAITFDVKGLVAKSSCLTCGSPITIPVSRTINTSLFDDGWNLIANPLPSPISWAGLRNGNANVDNAIYVFNADLNGGSGAHTSYVNGVSSDIAGGITDVIPMCQGFYVHATSSTVLTANESIKVNANPTFLKASATSTVKPIVRLVLDGSNNTHDLATFYFEQGCTPHFQTEYDAYKLIYDVTQPYVASMSDTVITGINGLPALNSNMGIPVKAITAITGSFNFSLFKSDFPNDVCVNLYDAFTGITTNILTTNYACTLFDTTTTARFTLNFFTTPLAGTSNAIQPTCSTPTNGIITATGNNSGPWNYEWKNGNTIVKTSLNKNTQDSLISLPGGNYTVKINTVGQCDNYSNVFTINPVVVPISGFTANSFTTSLSNGGQINFIDQSINAQTYFWDFGDGIGTSNGYNPNYSYSVAGSYLVKLITQSVDLCADTAMAFVTVTNDVAGFTTSSVNNSILLLYDKTCNGYSVKLNFSSPEDVQIDLNTISGQLLRTENFTDVTSIKLPIDLSPLPEGIYLYKITTSSNTTKTFKLIK